MLSYVKRDIYSDKTQRTSSPLMNWEVVRSTLNIDMSDHVYPETRNFQRNLIRSISKCPIADRFGKTFHVSHLQTLIGKNYNEISSLTMDLAEYPAFDKSHLENLLQRSRYDSHGKLTKLASFSSYINN